MAKTRTLMGASAMALVVMAAISAGTPASADCPRQNAAGFALPKSQIEACETREAGTHESAAFEQEEMRKKYYDAEQERRARIEASLAADAARARTQVYEILRYTGSLDSVGDVVAYLDHQEESFKRSAAPWLYSDVQNPWLYPEGTGGAGTGTGGGGTDTGGEGTDPGTGTGGGGTGTGGGTDTGGGTTDPDPETDLPVPPGEGTGGDGTEDGPIRVGLAPFPGEDVVWQCSNFRVLTPQEEIALGAVEGEVSFNANQLRVRGQDGVERTLSVQIVSDGNGEVVLVWPWPNQSALDAVCPA